MIYFLFGLCWGSFLNSLAYRLVKGEKFLISRSYCPQCRKILTWYELIPVLSFILQKGKCLSCGNKISLRYPATELLAGFFTYYLAKKANLLLFPNLTNFIIFLYFFIFLSLIFVLALYDLDTFYINEKIFYLAIISWLIFQLFIFKSTNIYNLDFAGGLNYLFYFANNPLAKIHLAFLSTLLILFIFVLTLGKGIGLGDAKMAFLLGLYLKSGELILVLFISTLLGSLYGLTTIILKKKIQREIPFVPFIFLAVVLLIAYGDIIANRIFAFMIKL